MIQEQMDKFAADFSASIDHDIVSNLLVEAAGWVRVDILPFDSGHRPVDMQDWAQLNCTGKFRNFGAKFVFESIEDAVMFKLRWS